MPDRPIHAGRLTIQALKGLNEREQHANADIGNFDLLRGGVPVNKNTITKANGCSLALTFSGESIMGICQTNDSRGNIIIQTTSRVYIATEAELFNQAASAPNLIPSTQTEEENMSQAIIVHTTAAGTDAVGYVTTNVWQTAPLSAIATQVNPDGSAAAFLSLAGSQINITAGKYRIRGWSIFSAPNTTRIACRLYNATTALPAWNGLVNEISHSEFIDITQNNIKLEFGGYLDLAVPTLLEVQGLMSNNTAACKFGRAMNTGGFTLSKELFRWVEVIKTA